MPVVLARIDQKLIHGQILSGWVPFLDVNEIVVVDEDSTQSPLIMRIMSSGVPATCATSFLTPDRLSRHLRTGEDNALRRLVLFKDVAGAKEAMGSQDLPIGSLNLGYYAHLPGIRCIKIHSFFSAVEEELEQLAWMASQGTEFYAQSVPNSPRVAINPDKFVWPWP
ncbi:MAG: PTS sugar transporter subunit IIB [Deltaproteobacteria bacterium]|jgi:mannose/fructose/N-acetylgalactosamine-specific phosphotransferase system component IIB|nr:PTS sugar transporter subunit IIB [Deltaproteobacteria bacterium]